MVLVAGIVGAGCAGTPKQAGFLSDYSRLEPVSGGLRYVDKARLSGYDEFIVDPVIVHFHDAEKAKKLDPDAVRELADHLRSEIVTALVDGYSVVTQRGPRVARVRIALTDIRHDTSVLNILPPARVSGVGLGGASMEAEVVDSQSGEQIAAAIHTQKGKRLSLDGFQKSSSAKAVMKDWAKRFRKRLDEAHGR
jgi:hypothetical protein